MVKSYIYLPPSHFDFPSFSLYIFITSNLMKYLCLTQNLVFLAYLLLFRPNKSKKMAFTYALKDGHTKN